MKKKILIGSIGAVVILLLAGFTPVVLAQGATSKENELSIVKESIYTKAKNILFRDLLKKLYTTDEEDPRCPGLYLLMLFLAFFGMMGMYTLVLARYSSLGCMLPGDSQNCPLCASS